MATPGAQDVFTPDNILQAMLTMRSPDREKKKVAMEYLDKFQKSVRCYYRPSSRQQTNSVVFACRWMLGT